jgi:hypothetical protein
MGGGKRECVCHLKRDAKWGYYHLFLGAQDNIFEKQSTFMVEASETGQILRQVHTTLIVYPFSLQYFHLS